MLDVQKLNVVHVRIVSCYYLACNCNCAARGHPTTLCLSFSMSKGRRWAAGVYDSGSGFMVVGGWSDNTGEKTLDGETFTAIGILQI